MIFALWAIAGCFGFVVLAIVVCAVWHVLFSTSTLGCGCLHCMEARRAAERGEC